MTNQAPPWVIRLLVPEAVYTGRAEFLDYFYETALKSAMRHSMSTVLLGRRRMGKTEIFRRVVRLFFEQDPQDPQAVVPVYYTFSDEKQDGLTFAREYLENFRCYYLAFYTQRPEIILDNFTATRLLSAVEASRSSHPYPKSLDRLLYWYEAMTDDRATERGCGNSASYL